MTTPTREQPCLLSRLDKQQRIDEILSNPVETFEKVRKLAATIAEQAAEIEHLKSKVTACDELSRLARIERSQLRQQLAEAQEKIKWSMADRNVATQAFKSKDEQFEFACDEVDALKVQLVESQAREQGLRAALRSIKEYWNQDDNNSATFDACWHAVEVATNAISQPTDNTALREWGAKLVERIATGCDISTKLYMKAVANKISKGEF